jgi:hypothetical protein
VDGRLRPRRRRGAPGAEAGLSERPGRAELAYAALVAAAFAAVALWRWDLVVGAARVTSAQLARGGAARGKLLFEIALFGAILAATLKTVPARPEPRRDVLIMLFGVAAGWAAEAWGTRAGLWTYYTLEKPPLWIVPAWPLGAAFIDRAARPLRESRGPGTPGAYLALSAAALALVTAFCAPRGAWAGPAVAAACLAVGARPAEDFWLLAAGMGAVLFADFWGTTNNCWRYYLHHQTLGLWRGIGFGMAFDAAVALGALKAARAALSAFEPAASPSSPRAT